jgi:hypothetical protein
MRRGYFGVQRPALWRTAGEEVVSVPGEQQKQSDGTRYWYLMVLGEEDKKRGNSLLEHADELGGCKVTGTASWRRGSAARA